MYTHVQTHRHITLRKSLKTFKTAYPIALVKYKPSFILKLYFAVNCMDNLGISRHKICITFFLSTLGDWIKDLWIILRIEIDWLVAVFLSSTFIVRFTVAKLS